MLRLWIDGKYPKMGRRYARAFGQHSFLPIQVDHWGNSYRSPIWGHDIFLQYPPSIYVEEADDSYQAIRTFYASNKAKQRVMLHEYGFSVPETISSSGGTPPMQFGGNDAFVVRPLRHTQGRGYRLSENPEQYDPQSEYLSRIFPKAWEYRVLISKGVPLVTLIKQHVSATPENRFPVSNTLPWNRRAGFRFVTVRNQENNRLRWTNLFDVIETIPMLKKVALVALDVMVGDRRALGLRRTPYAVSELNFAPLITLPANLEKVAQHYVSNS